MVKAPDAAAAAVDDDAAVQPAVEVEAHLGAAAVGVVDQEDLGREVAAARDALQVGLGLLVLKEGRTEGSMRRWGGGGGARSWRWAYCACAYYTLSLTRSMAAVAFRRGTEAGPAARASWRAMAGVTGSLST